MAMAMPPPPAKAARIDPEAPDRSSELPTSVLALILSLLPLPRAVRCAFVSKAWAAASLEMLSRAQDLHLGSDFARGLSRETYSRLVDGILALHQAETINSLKLFYLLRPDDDLSSVDKWLASKSASVVELELLVDHPFELRPLHSWKSLTCLSLASVPGDRMEKYPSLTFDVQSTDMPNLQRLCLRRLKVYYIFHKHWGTASLKLYSILDDFIQHCPKLSMVKLIDCNGLGGLTISSEHLCTLDIINCYMDEDSVLVDAPGLRKLHADCVAGEIELGNVVNLKDVYIRNEDVLGGNWFILGHLAHVTTLTLSDAPLLDILENVEVWTKEHPLTFNNLKSLQIVMDHYKDMEENYLKLLSNFLQFCNFPVLEDLFIEFPSAIVDGISELSVPAAPLINLRRVCIKGFEDLRDQFKLVEFLLASAVALDTLVLYMNAGTSDDKLASLWKKREALPKSREGLNILIGRVGDHLVGVPPSPHAEFRKEVSEFYDELVKASRATPLPW